MARRFVLLACLVSHDGSFPESLSGEFFTWPWESVGSIERQLGAALTKEPIPEYRPGRIVMLFSDDGKEFVQRIGGVAAEKFTELVARAVKVLDMAKLDARVGPNPRAEQKGTSKAGGDEATGSPPKTSALHSVVRLHADDPSQTPAKMSDVEGAKTLGDMLALGSAASDQIKKLLELVGAGLSPGRDQSDPAKNDLVRFEASVDEVLGRVRADADGTGKPKSEDGNAAKPAAAEYLQALEDVNVLEAYVALRKMLHEIGGSASEMRFSIDLELVVRCDEFVRDLLRQRRDAMVRIARKCGVDPKPLLLYVEYFDKQHYNN